MPSCLLGYFAVMLRQAVFAALDMYLFHRRRSAVAAQGKAPVFLKTGALSKKCSLSCADPRMFPSGKGTGKAARMSAR